MREKGAGDAGFGPSALSVLFFTTALAGNPPAAFVPPAWPLASRCSIVPQKRREEHLM